MMSVKRFFASILKKIQEKQVEYSHLNDGESLWLQLKNVKYGYGFTELDGKEQFIIQYPVIDMTRPYYNMLEMEQEFEDFLGTLNELLQKTEKIRQLWQTGLKKVGYKKKAQWFQENEQVFNSLYESVKDLGETKDVMMSTKKGTTMYGQGFLTTEMPAVNSEYACRTFFDYLDQLKIEFKANMDEAKTGKLIATEIHKSVAKSGDKLLAATLNNGKPIRLHLTDTEFSYGFVNVKGKGEYLICQYPIFDASISIKTSVETYAKVSATATTISSSVYCIANNFSEYEKNKVVNGPFTMNEGMYFGWFKRFYKCLKNVGKTKKVMLTELHLENPSKMAFGRVGYTVLKMPPPPQRSQMDNKSSQREWQLLDSTLRCFETAIRIPYYTAIRLSLLEDMVDIMVYIRKKTEKLV